MTALIFLPSLWLAQAGFRTASDSLQNPGLMQQALLTENIYKECGVALRQLSRLVTRSVTRWGLIGYYADRPVIDLPKGGPQEVIQYGRRNGGRFLVIHTPAASTRREELMELLAPLDRVGVNPQFRAAGRAHFLPPGTGRVCDLPDSPLNPRVV